MKKHINLWLVMFLAISLALPVYSMAQVTLTLEDPTGNRIVTPGIKSFAVGTDNNLVIYLDQPFNFKDLIPDISLASCTNCSIAGPAGVTATQGANLSFNVQSTDTSAVISLVASSYEIGPRTLTSTSGSAPFSWSTGSTLTGSYLAVFQALDGDQKSQLPVMINVVPPGYSLTINATNGSVTKSPNQATYTLSPVQTVQLTANAEAGYYFTGWSGALSGSTSPASITMDASKTVTATFAPIPPTQYSLTVTVSPSSAAGSVSLNPSGGLYTAGTPVTLTASANTGAGYTFGSWSGVDSSNGTTASVTMPSSDKAVTATFTTPTPVGDPLAWGLRNFNISGSPGLKRTFTITVAQGMTYGTFSIYSLDPNTDFTFKFTPVPGYQYYGRSVYTGAIQYGMLTLQFDSGSFSPKTSDGTIPPGNYTLEITFNDTGRITITSTIY